MALFNFGKKKEEEKKTPACACSCGCAASEAESITNDCCPDLKEGEICCIKVLGAGCKSCHEQFEYTKQAVKDMGLSVEVEYITDMQKVMEYGVMSMPALVVNEKGITITGFDERGAFYGIQTLKQLVESPVSSGSTLPFLEINDYPDLPNRGVVEGFYGTPWSHEVRLSLIDFYGKFKMNSYLYGPKDDPYHSCPNWRLPYPEKEAQHIKELVDACNRNYVDFVWAIHPGQDIKWNEEDYQNLINKFNWMYDLGVRHFAIFFDDISGEGTNPLKQTELLNRLTEEFVKVKGDVSPLTVCPTDYSKLWANPTEKGSLPSTEKRLILKSRCSGRANVVCSEPDTRNTRLHQLTHQASGLLLVELSGNRLHPQLPASGSGVRTGHQSHG